MKFNRCWEESMVDISNLVHIKSASLANGCHCYLDPEFLYSLSTLLLSQNHFERLMPGDIPAEALPHTRAIRLGGEILLNKLTEAADRYKNQHLKTASQRLNSAIELESAALIDG